MAKSLNGAELAGFIKERQAKQVRNLRQSHKIFPKLVIIMAPKASDVIGVYVRSKQAYAADILIETTTLICSEADMPGVIERLNNDGSVQGIIVQLPLDEPGKTDDIVNLIAPSKDIDGLGAGAAYPSATADAINWLCGGYSVDLERSKIAVIGQGRLVGRPLTDMWQLAGYDVTAVDIDTPDRENIVKRSDVIVAAAGVPRLIEADQLKHGAVVIDAGTASENGTVVGDVADSVRDRSDVSITPVRGGVGPLTVALLFDHLIQACYKK